MLTSDDGDELEEVDDALGRVADHKHQHNRHQNRRDNDIPDTVNIVK